MKQYTPDELVNFYIVSYWSQRLRDFDSEYWLQPNGGVAQEFVEMRREFKQDALIDSIRRQLIEDLQSRGIDYDVLYSMIRFVQEYRLRDRP